MKKRDVHKLKVGDTVRLRHMYGTYVIEAIATEPLPSIPRARYPLIQCRSDAPDPTSDWYTYLFIIYPES